MTSLLLGIVDGYAAPEQDHRGVIELEQGHLVLVVHLHDGEGGIGHLPHLADRQSGCMVSIISLTSAPSLSMEETILLVREARIFAFTPLPRPSASTM